MVLYILDGSNYQPSADLASIKRQGFSAIIAKATEGATGRDGDYRHKYADARDANLPFAAYHYISSRPPAEQADNCAGMVNDKTVPIFLDLERTYHASLAMAVNVGHALNQLGYDAPVLYLPRFYWSDDLNKPPHPPQFLLWQAVYARGDRSGHASDVYRNVPDSAWNSQGGEIPTLLQFSDLITVDGYRVNTWDCSAYDGTSEELRAEGIFKYWDSPPKPKPNPHPFPLKSGQYFGEGGVTHSEKLKPWQQRMHDRGWKISVDGVYGPETKSVAVGFQHEKHLHVDGLIGRITWGTAWTAPIT